MSTCATEAVRKTQEKGTQFRFLDPRRRVQRRKPASPTIALFRPLFQLLLHLEEEHAHLAGDDVLAYQPLVIAITADRALPHLSNQTGLFERLECRDRGRRHILRRPSFGNDPSPGIARRDQENLRFAMAKPKRQRSKLFRTFVFHSCPLRFQSDGGLVVEASADKPCRPPSNDYTSKSIVNGTFDGLCLRDYCSRSPHQCTQTL
jgi:hypothetical protein